MILVYIANLIITIVVGILVISLKEIDSIYLALSTIFLLLSLEIPTIYLMLANRKKLSRNDNELLIPSFIIFTIIFIVDIVFYSVCIIMKISSIKLIILYTIIFHLIMLAFLLIIKSFTNYIREQH